MISHSDLVAAVRERAGTDTDTATAAISAATGAIARHMLNEARERLATALPDTARYAAAVIGDVESPDGHEMIRDVAHQLDTTREWAHHVTNEVVAALDEAELGLVDLPPVVREVLVA